MFRLLCPDEELEGKSLVRNIKTIINRYRWMFNLFQIFGTRSPFPLVILAHLTTACGCKCSMCYQKQDPLFSNLEPKQMSLELFDQLLAQSGRFLRRPVIHLYGGEPLCHPEFDRIVKSLSQRGFGATMNTNGEFLEKYADLIAGSPIRMINVSVDGPQDIHDNIRQRPGLFNQAISGMKKLRRQDSKITLNLNYVIGKKNTEHLFDNILEIQRSLDGMRLDHFSIEHLAFTSDMQSMTNDLDSEKLKDELERVRAHQFSFPVSATPVIKAEDLGRYYKTFAPFEKINCNVPWIAAYVLPNGDVIPGGGMFACTEVMGNIGSETMGQIWNGKNMRDFRRRIKSAMPSQCNRCCHTIHYSPIVRCAPCVEEANKTGPAIISEN